MSYPRLSVNVNKIAWLRNARGGNVPNLVQMAVDCERFGAEGITVHPRPDERHIRYQDVLDLKEVVRTEYNIEGYPNERFLELVTRVNPTQCTLVPDAPGVLTSDAGWDTIEHADLLKDVIARLQESGIRVSLFIETDEQRIEAAKKVGADRIEFYTGPYAAQYPDDPSTAVAAFTRCAKFCNDIDLGINAGHDLDLNNLAYFSRNMPGLLEVSIGHALVSDALYIGMENTIQAYLYQLKGLEGAGDPN